MPNDRGELRKFLAPEFVFGAGARHLAGRYARHLGATRVLLVSDPGVVRAGWTGQVVESLQAEGLAHALVTAVSPNPRDAEVMAGAAVYRSEACDVIVAIGGGSVMDCAKGIGIVVSNGGHICDYAGIDAVPAPMPPLLCVPTTAGTSADVSQFAIINHVAEAVKIAVVSKAVVPDLALIDPEPLRSMSPYLSACTGMDALCHAVEAFVSNAHSPMTDLHALEAIRLVGATLERSVAQPDDLSLRTQMMLASLQAGLAFSNASLGAVHAMAHSLGGFKDLPHGECNALLLPHVIGYNFPAVPERYRKIAEVLGCEGSSGASDEELRRRVVDRVDALRQACGIRGGLGERGVRADDVPRLASKALSDPCNATNPRPPGQRDLEVVFGEAL
ncbi:MAG: iron-containing alcohol dehydrogenase [Myxococcales bacterium]